MHRRALIAALGMAYGGIASARPVEAIVTDQASVTADLRDMDRRAASLSVQIDQRKRVLKQRVRSLYKLAHGGSVRMLVDAGSPEEMSLRLWAAQRVVNRDLDELAALADETRELEHEVYLRDASTLRATQLDVDRATAVRQPRVGLEKQRGSLPRPVPGPIATGFSHVRTGVSGTALELPRRAVEMITNPGEPVRAVGNGVVRFVGQLDPAPDASSNDLGNIVVIDHGSRYVTVTGRLGAVTVAVGDPVSAGQVLGPAAKNTVSFELSEGRTALDPSSWMRAPVADPPPPR